MPPLWISHRGYKADGIENTRAAFDAAISRGFTALETDLRLSADGHIVLHHDRRLDRLAGIPRDIHEMTRTELENVKLGDRTRLLFFDEFVHAYDKATWTFDVKPETAVPTIRTLSAWGESRPERAAKLAQVRFVLWRPSDEQLVKELIPGAVCFAQERECWRAGIATMLGMPSLGAIRKARCYAITARIAGFSLFSSRVVSAYHSRGARVLAFLPATASDARAATAAGVDEILTDGSIEKG